MSANRYDSDEYLKAFKERREYPQIHEDLWSHIYLRGVSGNCLDICASIGLLGQHVADVFPVKVVAVEALQVSIDSGAAAGVTVPTTQMYVTPETLDQFIQIVEENEVRTLLARRALSEVFPAKDDPFAYEFCRRIHDAGVNYVYIQGRAVSTRSTHPMKSVEEERYPFLELYEEVFSEGQFSILRSKSNNPLLIKPERSALQEKSWI